MNEPPFFLPFGEFGFVEMYLYLNEGMQEWALFSALYAKWFSGRW